MCGIIGLLQSRPFLAGEILAMGERLRHRGPDDEGYLFASASALMNFGGEDTPDSVFDSNTGYSPKGRLNISSSLPRGGIMLGHRRLAIVDLSANGHQPMSYQERYWIVYNGEVYNYIELRAELEELGHSFASHTDTEVIMAAFAQWGPSCLARFNGMWALAILDRLQGTMFIARDRFGIKPIYYRVAQGRFAFASEIKAFSALVDWSPNVDVGQLMDFLVWGIIDHSTATMFAGVEQLAAGHYIMLDVNGVLKEKSDWVADEHVRAKKWYDLPQKGAHPPADAALELRAALEDAVRLRLRADVPVGSCLSGGLDSSAIVCLMSSQLAGAGVGGAVKTFTSRSDDAQFDESDYARAIVTATGSDAHYVTPSPEMLFEDLDRLVWHQDSPLISSSTIAQWLIFREAKRNGVTVMLDGQGADEILCGYRGFFGAYLASLVRQRRFATWLAEIRAMRREIGFSPIRSLGYTAAYLRPGLLDVLGRFDKRVYSDHGWLRPSYRWAFGADPVRRLGGRSSSVYEMSVAQVTATNLPMLLHWEDRDSMAFSVEARVPFLDYRVVELCLRMPDSAKLGGGISKAVLRRSMIDSVPEKILNRRDKMGFVTAEPLWMKQGFAAHFRKELIVAVDALCGIVDPSIIIRFDEVVAGTRSFDLRYWRVMSAALWMKVFSVRI